MRSFGLVLMLLLIAVAAVPAAAQETWGTTEVPVLAEVADAPSAQADAKTALGRPGLSIKQRRAMGITIRNVRKKVSEMQKAGDLAGMTQSEIAIAVMDNLVADNPKAFGDPGVDWDSVLAFIEKLIPLILKLMAIFGAM